MLVIDRVVIKKILSVCPGISWTQEFKTLMAEFPEIGPGIYRGFIVDGIRVELIRIGT